jgi:hypothetical protein
VKREMQVEYKARMIEEEEEVEKKMEDRIAFLLVATVSSLSSYIYNTISSFSMYISLLLLLRLLSFVSLFARFVATINPNKEKKKTFRCRAGSGISAP